MSNHEFPTDDDFNDAHLLQRIFSVRMGALHPDPIGETIEEQARAILATIARQLRDDLLTQTARGYLLDCLERGLESNTSSLDEAFFLRFPKKAGGQPVQANVERDTAKAYVSVILQRTMGIDAETGLPIYQAPSKEILKEAEQAAYLAYRQAVGKADEPDYEPDKKLRQTVKPILKRLGVLR